MSTREALIQEIHKQPESLLKELQLYLEYLVARRTKRESDAPSVWPEGYFDKTAGVFANEPFERPLQLPFERRQAW